MNEQTNERENDQTNERMNNKKRSARLAIAMFVDAPYDQIAGSKEMARCYFFPSCLALKRAICLPLLLHSICSNVTECIQLNAIPLIWLMFIVRSFWLARRRKLHWLLCVSMYRFSVGNAQSIIRINIPATNEKHTQLENIVIIYLSTYGHSFLKLLLSICMLFTFFRRITP